MAVLHAEDQSDAIRTALPLAPGLAKHSQHVVIDPANRVCMAGRRGMIPRNWQRALLMQQKQAASLIEFVPDAETLKILEAVAHGARDNYINNAIKAFSQAAPAAKTQVVSSSPVDQVNAELQRLFGPSFDAVLASKADNDDYVVLKEVNTPTPVRCGTKDVLDILKSLRQPITVAEVWEIASVLS